MRVIVIAVAALLLTGCGTAGSPALDQAGRLTAPTTSPSPPVTPPPASALPPAAPPSPTAVPLLERGPGTFTAAAGGDGRIGGSGELIAYRVEVEDGIEIEPDRFAEEVDGVLAHPRGWTAGDQWSFERVAGSAGLVLRLATPDTVDETCGQFGLDTGGETSCRGGDYVIINLRRWLLAVPHFDDLVGYRRYVINHEVGHRLGYGHMGCPSEGGPAPVMLQQTLRLEGCEPNSWPYVDGELLTGPYRP